MTNPATPSTSKFIKFIDGKKYILRSEVLKAIETARADERELIARAIETQDVRRIPDTDRDTWWHGYCDAQENAAQIARNGGRDE